MYHCPDCKTFFEDYEMNFTVDRPATLVEPAEHSAPKFPCCGEFGEHLTDDHQPCTHCWESTAICDDVCPACLVTLTKDELLGLDPMPKSEVIRLFLAPEWLELPEVAAYVETLS